MSFTTLYAELVVVGTGALIFVLLLFYSFFGDVSWFSRLKASRLVDAVALIPVLSVIYLLGIVIANLSHLLFQCWENSLQTQGLKKCGKEYAKIRGALYIDPKAKDLVVDFEFRRSKVRICRGWFLNSFFIIIALAVCALKHRLDTFVALFWILGTGLLMFGTLVSWWTATTTELAWLSEYAEKLPEATSAKEEGAAASICF
jgi:hypothetical protein